MKRNKFKMLMLIDHSIDPRLLNRVSLLVNSGFDVTVCHDSTRAPWLKSNRSINYLSYDQFKNIKCNDYDLLYVSGARVFIDYFFRILLWKFRRVVVSEIPDLPLRKKNYYLNIAIALFFKSIVTICSNLIVVTSPGFLKLFSSNRGVIVRENFPSHSDIESMSMVGRGNDDQSKVLTIGFVGAIRYLSQLQLLIQAQDDLSDVFNINIHGGPDSDIRSLIENMGFKTKIGHSIFIFGPYSYKDEISRIYSNIDLIFSVYDSIQPNVRLALPNKLYEAIVVGKPILVAKDTFLAEVVSDLRIGWALPYLDVEQSEFTHELSKILEEVSSYNVSYDFRTIARGWDAQDSRLLRYLCHFALLAQSKNSIS